MQEEVDEKTVALVINGGRISAGILKSALEKLVQKIEEKNRIHEQDKREKKKETQARKAAEKEAGKASYKPGRKTLNTMMAEGSELTNIEITDNNIRSFEKVARKYSIDYSLKKDKSEVPPKYLVFFRARDVDVMTAAFKEYTGMSLTRSRKASIRKRLQKAIGRSSQAHHRERQKVKEKNREPER